jgi:hypothetical protein
VGRQAIVYTYLYNYFFSSNETATPSTIETPMMGVILYAGIQLGGGESVSALDAISSQIKKFFKENKEG